MNTTDKINKINEWQELLKAENTTLAEKRTACGFSIQSAATYAGVSLATGFKIEHGGGVNINAVYRYYKTIMERENENKKELQQQPL